MREFTTKTIEELQNKLDALRAEKTRIDENIRAIEKVLEITLPMPILPSPYKVPNKNEPTQKIKPTIAVLELLKSNSDRSFSPPEVKEELYRVYKEGRLISKHKKFIQLAHSALRSLTTSKKIIRSNDNGLYKYNQNFKTGGIRAV